MKERGLEAQDLEASLGHKEALGAFPTGSPQLFHGASGFSLG